MSAVDAAQSNLAGITKLANDRKSKLETIREVNRNLDTEHNSFKSSIKRAMGVEDGSQPSTDQIVASVENLASVIDHIKKTLNIAVKVDICSSCALQQLYRFGVHDTSHSYASSI
jgi:hypothetical protein